MRPLVKPGVPLPKMSPYPGHYAVVRSVVEGLRAIDADFNFNPRRIADLARVVYAPENASLRQAAALKRRGRIDYLVAGPVNALFPDEADGVLQLPEIDRLIVASEWVHGLYGETPKLLEKSVACPCGIDARYWHPSGQPRMKTALVYWKSGDEAFCEQVERIVRAVRPGAAPPAGGGGRARAVRARRLPATARRVAARRVPERVRNPGSGAGRGVVDGRADGGVGSAGRGRVAREDVPGRLVRAVSDPGHRPARGDRSTSSNRSCTACSRTGPRFNRAPGCSRT